MPERNVEKTRAIAPRDRSISRFFLQLGVLMVLFTGIGFGAAYVRTTSLLESGALDTARSNVDLVLAARSWNAAHSGVWVVRSAGVETNPYLAKLGVSADATTTDGRAITLRNPAAMTREISDIISAANGVRFHLTSLKPVNPSSAPDAWERETLAAFDRGGSESWRREVVGGRPTLRYMRPLMTTAECLTCHARQGYRVGDVRGAISVIVPMDSTATAISQNAIALLSLATVAAALFVGISWLFVRRMRARLERAQAELVEAATIDQLTGAATRRHAIELLHAETQRAARTGDTLAVIIIDIDVFKRVNDTFGHAAGDHVLAAVAQQIRGVSRPYDTLGRMGGEEFLLIAPDIDLAGAVALAQRAREAVSADAVETGVAGGPVTVTISLGVTLVDPREPDAVDRALSRADAALYRSKESGRDRVSVDQCDPGSSRTAE